MLEFSVLASGSKANCIYVASAGSRVLIDCGLSAKQAALRLQAIGVEPETIDAVVVSHEHDDHVCGVRVFSKRFGTPVWATGVTCAGSECLQAVQESALRSFSAGAAFSIGDLHFTPFSVDHDAADPVAFRIQSQDKALAIVTDLGKVTPLVEASVRDVDAIILEANHDWNMLMDGPYPWQLKQRIAGRKGHLRNEDAGALLESLNTADAKGRLRYAVAAHISENNNTPHLALEVFRSSWSRGALAGPPAFLAANPYEPTARFQL